MPKPYELSDVGDVGDGGPILFLSPGELEDVRARLRRLVRITCPISLRLRLESRANPSRPRQVILKSLLTAARIQHTVDEDGLNAEAPFGEVIIQFGQDANVQA